MDIGTWHFNKNNVLFILFIGFVLLVFINVSRTAKVIPENSQAVANRIIEFKYFPSTGKGKLEARLRSGEKLKGEYALVVRGSDKDQEGEEDSDGVYRLRENSMSVGQQYKRLLDMTFGATESSKMFYRGEMRGDRGTRIACEYYFNKAGNDGVGACKSSEGARYRIIF